MNPSLSSSSPSSTSSAFAGSWFFGVVRGRSRVRRAEESVPRGALQVRPETNSGLCSTGVSNSLDYVTVTSLHARIIQTDQYYAKLGHMEQQLEKILDTVMSKCRNVEGDD